MGDTVIEIQYPPSIIKKISVFFGKYSSLKDINMVELTSIVHTKCLIKFILYKNKIIADNIKQIYLPYFKKD